MGDPLDVDADVACYEPWEMRVLALDPGERVGWCSAVVLDIGKRDPAAPPDPKDVRYVLRDLKHGIAYLKDCAMQVHQAVAIEKRYDVVIYEEWILTAKGARVSVGSRMESSQFVGMIRLACWLGGAKLVPQRTSALSSADRSLKCGHPSAPAVQDIITAADAVSHDDGHDGSAARHLWTWFFKEYV